MVLMYQIAIQKNRTTIYTKLPYSCLSIKQKSQKYYINSIQNNIYDYNNNYDFYNNSDDNTSEKTIIIKRRSKRNKKLY